jgi:hypothetical protein
MARPELESAIAELGLTVESEFVPWSQSRNKGEKHPSLNWRVTVKRNGAEVLTTDYGAGNGHCPAYKRPDSYMKAEAIKWECEHGRRAVIGSGGQIFPGSMKSVINPDPVDVIHSLALDSDVLNHNGFESWAGDFGYDTDSRKAESIYRACLDIALKLCNAIGDDGMRKLQEAGQDY